MSPTVFREGPYRFYFFSREEERMHIHVQGPDGEAKVWLEPKIELATSVDLRQHQLKALLNMVKEHQDEIRNTWKRHFQS